MDTFEWTELKINSLLINKTPGTEFNESERSLNYLPTGSNPKSPIKSSMQIHSVPKVKKCWLRLKSKGNNL